MEEKIKKYWWLIIIIIIFGGVFYWFQWRPTQIIKECFNEANGQKMAVMNSENTLIFLGSPLTKRADYDKIFNDIYQECLLKNGLSK